MPDPGEGRQATNSLAQLAPHPVGDHGTEALLCAELHPIGTVQGPRGQGPAGLNSAF